MSLDFLPKELENIIINYKNIIEQYEHSLKFNKTLKHIKSLNYKSSKMCSKYTYKNNNLLYIIKYSTSFNGLKIHQSTFQDEFFNSFHKIIGSINIIENINNVEIIQMKNN